jgi:hypothetical protein
MLAIGASADSSQPKEPFREDCVARLNPKQAKAPVTMSATQLSHIGTLQLPSMKLQPKMIRTRWSRATREKTTAVIRRYALRDMA